MRADERATQPGTFDFRLQTRIVHGRGVVDRAGELVAELGAKSALVVTDAGIVRAGHVDRVRDALTAAGVRVEIFDEVHENPTTADVAACVAAAEAAQPETIVGLGGGSSLDTAKGCNFVFTNGGRMQDYWGYAKAAKPMLPLVAIPTTAGTGSDVQSYALISDETTHQKMACGDPKVLPRVTIVDPELAVSQPHFVIACSGLDAIAHAVETAVTTRRTDISRLFSREAFRLGHTALPRVLENAGDLDAQSTMMLAAAYAGLAIENSMLGAAHSMSNPLTADFDVVHGQAVGLALPHVVRFNADEPSARAEYAALAQAAGLDSSGGASAVDALVARLETLYAATGLPPTLDACGVPRSAAPALAEGAARQWTAQFNPRPVAATDFETLYAAAFGASA